MFSYLVGQGVFESRLIIHDYFLGGDEVQTDLSLQLRKSTLTNKLNLIKLSCT